MSLRRTAVRCAHSKKTVQLATGGAYTTRCQNRLFVMVHLAFGATAPIWLMLSKSRIGVAFHPQAMRAIFFHGRKHADAVLMRHHTQKRISYKVGIAYKKRARTAHLCRLDNRIHVGEQTSIELVAQQGNASRSRTGKALFLVFGARYPYLAALVFHAGLHACFHGRTVTNHQQGSIDCLLKQR